MQPLLLFLVLLICCGASAAIGRATALRQNRKSELSQRDRAELSQLREMRDALLRQALERVEVDPYAVTTIDTIRTHQRKITE